MAERERFGYTDAEGNRVSALRDMFDGGGRGRSGSRFEGGGIISSIGNAMGGPAAFGGGDNSRDSRGAVIGRTVGGMMFGPLGMIGGGILGNMIGRGRGSAMAPQAAPAPAQRPSMPAAVAMAPPASPMPTQRPAGAGPMGMFPVDLPPATQRFIEQYGLPMSDPSRGYTPPALPGAVPMSQPPMMSGGVDQMSVPLVGYLPRAAMPVDPMMNPFDTSPLMIDFRTALPIAMTPPRVQ